MKFKIPFTIASNERLKKNSLIFAGLFQHKKDSKLQQSLKDADVNLSREEYLGIIAKNALILFITLYSILTGTFFILDLEKFYLISLPIALLPTIFIFAIQIVYPNVYTKNKEKNIERNLIPALEDMLVQLNSGVPLFTILVNISSSKYGELTNEFKKAVKQINSGRPQIDVLEELGERNSSLYFRRAIWQISNGMRAGSDISIVIRESVKTLTEEQIIQIQSYGNKLNPIIMFYMLSSVIMPALGITFLTIISSMIGLSSTLSTIIFVSLLIGVTFLQAMFIGVIKSLRPTLM